MERPDTVAAQRVGRYILVERLAVGGMAEVFLACERHDPKDASGTYRLVVLKRILPHLADHAEFVDAFAREARIAARIRHPNVVRIHELGEAGGLPYMTMEYLPGTTLKELLASARAAGAAVPVGVALYLLGQAIDGAHATHEVTDPAGKPYGLVHRDITPHNLMVDDEARVKLIDFGIAKASEGVDQTRTGVLKGKIAYMSPEQCRQDKLDRRADVFSLGVVGYQLLTGRKPFQQSSELATMQAIILGRYPPLSSVRPELPEPVCAEIAKALEGDPARRHQTAREMGEALLAGAGRAGIELDADQASAWVRRYLGPAVANRRQALDQALSRTLGSIEELRLDTESLERAHLSDHGRTPAPATPRPVSRTHRSAAPDPAEGPRPTSAGRWAAGGLLLAVATIVGALGWVDQHAPRSALPPLRLAVAPVADPERIGRDLEPVRAYLERALDRPIELTVGRTYADAADAVASGQSPIGLLPANTAAHARAENPAVSLLGVEVVDGSTSSDAYLVVRRADAIRSIHDLVGRTICWVDPLSDTGYALPRAFLRDHGVDPDRDVGSIVSGNHEQVLRDLLAGRCDAAATFSGSWVTADARGIATARLRILAITGSSPHEALVAGPGLDRSLLEPLRDAILAYEDSTDRAAPGLGLPITGFEPPPPDYAELPSDSTVSAPASDP